MGTAGSVHEAPPRWIMYRVLSQSQVLIRSQTWNAQLPHLIEAFTIAPGRYDLIASAHIKYQTEYLQEAATVPVVEFDVHNWETPFRIVSQDELESASQG